MIIDKDTQEFINLRIKNNSPEIYSLTPIELRAMRAAMACTPTEHQVEIRSIRDISFKKNDRSIKIRIYKDVNKNKKTPLIIFFHGGGFVMGDLESHDLLCRHICKKTKSTLIAIDYRLAPENKFPSALEDALDATNQIIKNFKELNFDKNKVVVCGDSAGGNLALLISIYSKIKIIPKIHGQILIYPWVDFTMSRPSINIELNGILVNKKTLLYFAAHYLKNENDITDWRISPILFPDLSDLPPTYIFGAGIDPLVDEGEALSRRLRSFNNEVHYKLYPGQMHAFVSNIVSLPTSLECIHEICESILKILNK